MRKIYLDSRFRQANSSHADATFELPFDVETNPQLSMVLGGMTFVNSLETVWEGNSRLYYRTNYQRHVQTRLNRNLYFTVTTGSTTVGQVAQLDQKVYDLSTLADELLRCVSIYFPGATVTKDGNICVIVADPDPVAGQKLFFPTRQQLMDPSFAWAGPTFDRSDPQDFNRYLTAPPNPGTSPAIIMTLPTLPLQTWSVASLDSGVYDGASLADELHRVLVYYAAFDEKTGTLSVDTGDNQVLLNFPTPDQLRSPAWKAANWTGDYDVRNPMAFNGAINPPAGFARLTKTDNLDLQTVREVYLHSNLCNNTSLSPSGATDVLARVPIEVAWGFLQTFRPYSVYDTEAVRLTQGSLRNIKMTLRDAFGVIVPLSHAVTYELTIIDTPM